ncbi:MAG: hypothetical protein LBQ88_07375 [Treponema sp.]|jgi:hypothetical protein|nr:hypothetical protein [Treponema sp.]
MKVKRLYTIFLLVLFFVLTGCTGQQKQPTGNWSSLTNGIPYSMALFKDGTGSMDIGGISFICKYRSDKDMIIFEVDGDTTTHLYTLSPNGKTLEIRNFLESGVNVTFKKQ